MHLSIVFGDRGEGGQTPGKLIFLKKSCQIPVPWVNIACQIPGPMDEKIQ